MDQLHSKSVVVGIDGSQAAVNAAKWAVDEAISRQIPPSPCPCHRAQQGAISIGVYLRLGG
jgi:nucleotide-binding universal stress UspA family protein